MSLQKEDKARIISEFQKHENDVGSAEVQIGILNGKIQGTVRACGKGAQGQPLKERTGFNGRQEKKTA